MRISNQLRWQTGEWLNCDTDYGMTLRAHVPPTRKEPWIHAACGMNDGEWGLKANLQKLQIVWVHLYNILKSFSISHHLIFTSGRLLFSYWQIRIVRSSYHPSSLSLFFFSMKFYLLLQNYFLKKSKLILNFANLTIEDWNFYWSIVDLQWCLNFRCIAKYLYIYIYIFSNHIYVSFFNFFSTIGY